MIKEFFNRKINRKKGLTIIEMMLVLAIFFLLVYLSIVAFSKLQQKSLLEENLQQLVGVVRKSQNKAAAGETFNNQHLKFGVLFTSNSYQEFATFTDFNQRQTDYDLTNFLPKGLNFINLNLPDTCLLPNDCLIFSSNQATPSAEGSLVLDNINSPEQKIIYINSLGQINY